LDAARSRRRITTAALTLTCNERALRDLRVIEKGVRG
jgi:hypothetical protein